MCFVLSVLLTGIPHVHVFLLFLYLCCSLAVALHTAMPGRFPQRSACRADPELPSLLPPLLCESNTELKRNWVCRFDEVRLGTGGLAIQRHRNVLYILARQGRFVVELIPGFHPAWDGSSAAGKLEVPNFTVIFESPSRDSMHVLNGASPQQPPRLSHL